jgi:hypothetical protein
MKSDIYLDSGFEQEKKYRNYVDDQQEAVEKKAFLPLPLEELSQSVFIRGFTHKVNLILSPNSTD